MFFQRQESLNQIHLQVFVGYALKKVVKILVVIIWLFVAALVYLEYQRIIQVDWILIQALSQN
jgi:uncharacterized membrane protein (Fun14 family)